MDGKKSTKRIIGDRNLRLSGSQYNIDQQDRDNDPPPHKKKKSTSLLKGTKSFLNHCSTAPKSPPSPISSAGTNLKYNYHTQGLFFS